MSYVAAHVHVAALRASQDHLAALVSGMTESELVAPSYASEWTIAHVLSHLGSQAEIFDLILDAALAGEPAPGVEAFHPVWDRWNAKSSTAARDDSLVANDRHVARYEALHDSDADTFHLRLFGMELGLADLVDMRLAEHAVHTWDIEVVRDPDAALPASAASLLIDRVATIVARSGRPGSGRFRIRVGTVHPVRDLVVTVGDAVTIDTAEPDDSYDGSVDLPAEAFVRLAYGRLDPHHTPEHAESGSHGLADLRATFPGV